MIADGLRNVGVVCGIHGNEPKSLESYEYFQRHPLARTEIILGNPLACATGLRYTADGQNLNTCFPGDPASLIYEQRRARELMRWAARFDVVIDIHGNPAPDSDCIIMRPEAPLTLQGITNYLQINRAVTSTDASLVGTLPHAASIDLGTNTPIQPSDLHAMVEDLTRGAQWYPHEEVQWYEFVGSVTKADADHSGPPIPAFGPLPDELANRLGIDPDHRAIFWEPHTGNPFLCELVLPTDDPWSNRHEQIVSA